MANVATRFSRYAPRGLANKGKARKYLARRDGARCFYCQKPDDHTNLTIEHVTALSRGGTNDFRNLRLACADCNKSMGNQSPERKLLIRRTHIRSKRNP